MKNFKTIFLVKEEFKNLEKLFLISGFFLIRF